MGNRIEKKEWWVLGAIVFFGAIWFVQACLVLWLFNV